MACLFLTILGYSNMLAGKFMIIFGLCITQSNSCVFFEMYTGTCEGPMYYQHYGPTESGLNLFDCAQWCMSAEMCKSVVWEQGVCAQVGLAGNGERVTENVFTPKRPILLPGEFEWIHEIIHNLLQSLWLMLWILFCYVLAMITSLLWLFLHNFEPFHWQWVSAKFGPDHVTQITQSMNLIHNAWHALYLNPVNQPDN